MNRREVLKTALAAATVGSMPSLARVASATPQVKYFSLFCYPWDVVDLGIEQFARLAADTGLTNISISSNYHDGKVLSPHNATRRVYFVEGGALHFPPSARFFGRTRMRPLVSRLTDNRDLWKEITEACAARGVRTTAWTISLHNNYLGAAYPQYTTRNVFGDRYLQALCPSQPAVVEYMRALAGNLASYPALDAVTFELFHFVLYRHFGFVEKEGIAVTPSANLLLSLCFCDECVAAANRHKVNGGKVALAVKAWLEQYFEGEHREQGPAEPLFTSLPGLDDYLQMRFGVLESCFAEGAAALHAQKKKVLYLAFSDRQLDHARGIDLKRLATHSDGIDLTFYGRKNEEAPVLLRNIRVATRADMSVYFITRPGYPDATKPADVVHTTQALLEAGTAGVSYYNFGLFEKSHMDWIRQAIEAARA